MPKYATKADRRRAHKRAKQAAARYRALLPEHFEPILSVIAQQPDDRPHNSNLPKSHSWVSVPPTVERTSRRTEKPTFADSITGMSTADDTRAPSGEGHRVIRKSMGA